MPYADPVEALEYRKQYYIKNKESQKKYAIENYYLNHERRKIQKKEWAIKNADKLKEYRKTYAPIVVKKKHYTDTILIIITHLMLFGYAINAILHYIEKKQQTQRR